MKGFTLVELIVVMGIVSTLLMGSYLSITSFQSQSQVETAASELLATLRDAQSKSRSGQLPAGKAYADYDPGNLSNLPVYSVELSGHTYHLCRTDVSIADGAENCSNGKGTEETHTIDATVTITPSSATVVFSRVTGLPSNAQTFTLQKGTSTNMRTVTVNTSGLLNRQ